MGEKHRFHRAYEPFTCAICQREFDGLERYFMTVRDAHIPPVCFVCEDDWQPEVRIGGSHRDRRLARQVGALAEALMSHAYLEIYNSTRDG